MAQVRTSTDAVSISCPVCLELLKDPVTTPCGHSYCMRCLNRCWDREAAENIPYSCPQCRETFTPRPCLNKNVVLAELVEQLKKARCRAAPADHHFAGPGDVACDFCTGRRRKARKSCLVCLVSYCDHHLAPHLDGPAFKRHKLVEPTKDLEENICSNHSELLKLYCRTDRQVICSLCTMDQHKGHDTVPAAAARREREAEVGRRRSKLQQRIQVKEKDVKVLRKKGQNITVLANKAVKDSHCIFRQMMRLLQKRMSRVEQQIRAQEENDMMHVLGLCDQLEQEIVKLKKEDAELEKLCRTENHTLFLQNLSSVSAVSADTVSAATNVHAHSYFEDVAAAVSASRDELQDFLRDTWNNFSQALTQEERILLEAEPQTRAEFLRYSRQITLDPNTAESKLSLSEGNRRVTEMEEDQFHPAHPDRFTTYSQVLSKETLTGRCYWEVEWNGGGLYAAVAYNSITRAGDESGFGDNSESWSLYSNNMSCLFRHNRLSSDVSECPSPKLGVYLDHSAGLLSFYRVSETMTLLHRVHTSFTQPLHAGVLLCHRTVCEFLDLN
ncbi:finTRIM family, member 64 [Neosynchiropus ocellatus]